MTRKIYMDEATTSWPKSKATIDALAQSADVLGSSSRGLPSLADRELAHARSVVAHYFSCDSADNFIFVPGATYGTNLVLKGYLKPGDKVLVSISEHNAVLRPLAELAACGVEVEWLASDAAGRVDVSELEQSLAHDDKAAAIICQHGSNVTGLLQPVEEICAFGNKHGIPVIVDGAQTGGHIPVNLATLNPAAWICSGHKGLRGVKGIGVLYLREDFKPQPLITGGTGFGDESVPPLERPTSYEAGTEPLPAIMALRAALENENRSLEEIEREEAERTKALIEGIGGIEGIRVLGAGGGRRLPIVSVTSDRHSPDELAFMLSRKYGIATRPGIHCAPKLHKHLETFQSGGAVRFSFSHETSFEDIESTIRALTEIFR